MYVIICCCQVGPQLISVSIQEFLPTLNLNPHTCISCFSCLRRQRCRRAKVATSKRYSWRWRTSWRDIDHWCRCLPWRRWSLKTTYIAQPLSSRGRLENQTMQHLTLADVDTCSCDLTKYTVDKLCVHFGTFERHPESKFACYGHCRFLAIVFLYATRGYIPCLCLSQVLSPYECAPQFYKIVRSWRQVEHLRKWNVRCNLFFIARGVYLYTYRLPTGNALASWLSVLWPYYSKTTFSYRVLWQIVDTF